MVAYNAASTVASTLDRIPPDFRSRIEGVYLGDNASEDSTYLVGLGYQQAIGDVPLTVVRHPRNLGYGGNQKAGYEWAIEQGFDIVVLLHADGQYAPEFLPEIVAPLESGEADAVFGSRMMQKGEARKGGMPLYKYVGNKILSRFQNAVVGMDLSEWHSGYRAYSVATLRDIPFELNTDDYNFDTQIILQLHEAGKRIVELPIPTFYGDEISYVSGMRYAKELTKDVLRYRAEKMGFGRGDLAFATSRYDAPEGPESAHGRVVAWLTGRSAARILDLGCGDGSVASTLRAAGHEVVGVDREKHEGIGERVDQFVEADLERGVPVEVDSQFDIVLAVDVLSYLKRPEELLGQVRGLLRPGGSLIATVPNFGHWYPRMRVALGRFDYDRRGILDEGHVRFFTRRSFERLAHDAELAVRRREHLGVPVEVLERGAPGAEPTEQAETFVERADRVGLTIAPELFAYQFLYELEPAPRA